jgi:hypothetical protein
MLWLILAEMLSGRSRYRSYCDIIWWGGKNSVRCPLCFSTRSTGNFSFPLLQSIRLLTKLYLPHETLCPLPHYTKSSLFLLRGHSFSFLPLYVMNVGKKLWRWWVVDSTSSPCHSPDWFVTVWMCTVLCGCQASCAVLRGVTVYTSINFKLALNRHARTHTHARARAQQHLIISWRTY